MSFDLNKNFAKLAYIPWLKMTENWGQSFFQMLTQQTLPHPTQLEDQK